MMFVLDTNVVSELRKARLGKADTNVMAWTQSIDWHNVVPDCICPGATSAMRLLQQLLLCMA